MGIIECWSLLAVILHFANVGEFATWPVIDWPWHWSCLCLEIYVCIVYIVIISIGFAFAIRDIKKAKKFKIETDRIHQNIEDAIEQLKNIKE